MFRLYPYDDLVENNAFGIFIDFNHLDRLEEEIKILKEIVKFDKISNDSISFYFTDGRIINALEGSFIAIYSADGNEYTFDGIEKTEYWVNDINIEDTDFYLDSCILVNVELNNNSDMHYIGKYNILTSSKKDAKLFLAPEVAEFFIRKNRDYIANLKNIYSKEYEITWQSIGYNDTLRKVYT